MARDFVETNNASRKQLDAFVGDLSTDDLVQVNADGWTVAALLVHMAFWDQRMGVLLDRWLADGVSESPTDADMINDTMRPIAPVYLLLAAAGLFWMIWHLLVAWVLWKSAKD